MPYIKQELRAKLEPNLDFPALNAGELNFQITCVIREYWAEHQNYQGINDILGALEGAKLEFVRRTVNPYEDQKILENGDL